jgi:hypothetical protein
MYLMFLYKVHKTCKIFRHISLILTDQTYKCCGKTSKVNVTAHKLSQPRRLNSRIIVNTSERTGRIWLQIGR